MSKRIDRPMTGRDFDALSDAEKEPIYQDCEKVGPDDGVPLTAEQRALVRKFRAKALGRPRVGAGAQRVQITVERGLLREADALAKRQGLSRSQLIAHGLVRLLKHKRARRSA